MGLALKSVLNNKQQEQWFTDCMETLTKSASQEGFFKASQEIAPMIDDLKPESEIQVLFPYGKYTCTVGDLKETVNQVIETRERNQAHYDAIEKANTVLSTLETFKLDGIKPDNKRGAPKKERKIIQ